MSRLQDLRLNDEKRRNPNPGQKRLPPDSTDGDRRKKHSRSPEVHLATMYSSLPRREPSSNRPLHTDQLGSGQAAEPSSGFYQDAADSPDDRARDPGPRRTDKKNDRQGDRSESPPDQGGGEDEVPEGDTSMLLQPDTRPITPEQLVNEVKGIYSGLVMVEKKCVEIITQRASTGGKLSNDQWQALIALHRTLLHEHHDFFVRRSPLHM